MQYKDNNFVKLLCGTVCHAGDLESVSKFRWPYTSWTCVVARCQCVGRTQTKHAMSYMSFTLWP